MKHLYTVSIMILIATILFCVDGPATIEENGHRMPEKAVQVTSADFDQRINAPGVAAIVEFYSVKCAVCTSLVWVIDSIYENYYSRVVVAANNTDEDTLWERFSITSVPAYVLFRSGQEITRLSFVRNEPEVYDTLAVLLDRLLDGTLSPDVGDTGIDSDTVLDEPLTLDVGTFDSTILRSGTVAMVFFLYDGGAPCIYMEPVIKSMLPRFKDKAVIAKVHAWEQSEISDRYGIDRVPQFLFFKDGAEHTELRRVGIVDGDTLAAILEGLLVN